MSGIYEIARLTVHESRRRWTSTGGILVALIMIIGMAFLFQRTERRIEQRRVERGQTAVLRVHGEPVEHAIFSELMRKGGMWIVRTFSMFLAILLGAGAISNERESGAIYTLTSKPVSRAEILLGKWLGINAVMVVYLIVLGGTLTGIMWWRTGEPNTKLFYGAMASWLFPALFATVTLCFSTRLSTWLAMGGGLVCWLIGSQEYGLMRIIAYGLMQGGHTEGADTAFTVSHVCGLLVPTGRIGLWIDSISGRLDLGMFGGGPRFPHPDPTSWDLAYVGLYIAALLILSIYLFAQTDL